MPLHDRVGVTIETGPASWQILQQDENHRAQIDLAGRWMPRKDAQWDSPQAGYRVEARLVYESSGRPVTSALDWTGVEMLSNRTWHITLRDVPAGGLYRVETRVARWNLPDSRPLRGDYIHCIGVGDLWCIAGQSNASGTGSGIVEDPPELGVHVFANDEQWKIATHPLEDATRTLHPVTITGIYHGHSPWLVFGKTLRRELGIPIGLIPTALGGSPLQMWNPEEPGRAILYENMMDMIAKAGGRIRGILWYQGESDANPTTAPTYGARFRQFVEHVRRDLRAPELPIVTAQLNRVIRPTTTDVEERAWSMVRQAQWRVAREIPFVYVVPTLDLPLGDEIHNSAPAEVVLGERFARLVLGKVYRRDADVGFPELAEARFANLQKTEIILIFRHVAGGWLPWCGAKAITDFCVEDEQGWLSIAEVNDLNGNQVRIHLASAPRGNVKVHGGYGTNPTMRLRDANLSPIIAFSVPVQ